MENYCPICSYSDFTMIGKPESNAVAGGFIDRDYQVVQCSNCKLYYVLPKINFTDEQWSKLYNSKYFASQSSILLKRRKRELKNRFNMAEKLFEGKNPIRFLDIGAGEGKTLIEGLERNWEVTGIDIVDNRIPQAKNDKIEFLKAKFIEYDFPQSYFDFIYLDSVLEHILIPVEYLNKISRILKRGGILYVGVPNEDSLFNDLRRIIFSISGKKNISVKLKPFDSPYHVVGFNSTSLKFIIEKSGLQIKYYRNFGRKFEFLSSKMTSRAFWVDLLFLFPVEIIGYLMKRDVYFEAYLIKIDHELIGK